MSAPNYLPSLGMTGLWALNAPYSSLVLATTQYKCISTQSLAGAVAQGLDPLNSVYLANNDTQASFNRDLANDDYLIVITSGPGDIVTFPRAALSIMPSSDGVLYRNTMLAVSLSAIPDSLSLTSLKNQMSALVLNNLGVKSSVYEAQIGTVTILTTQQSTALEAARNAAITTPQSLMYQNAQLQNQLAEALIKIQMLSTYITQHSVST